MNATTGKCCDHCELPDDEGCAFPWYGLAPHSHDMARTGSFIGSTVLEPRDTWPKNFREDPDCEGCGTYEYCPHCAGEVEP